MPSSAKSITKPEEKILRHGIALHGAMEAADADLLAAEQSLRDEEPRILKTIVNLGGSFVIDGHRLEVETYDPAPVYPAHIQEMDEQIAALLKKCIAAKEAALREGNVTFDEVPSSLIITRLES